MTKTGRLLGGIALSALLLPLGCLEAPGVGGAADPSRAENRAPVMGSTTTNQEVAKKVEILEKLLDGEIDEDQASKAIDQSFADLPVEERKKRVASLKQALNEMRMAAKGGGVQGLERQMIVARLYFSERRFIEAAKLLSAVLDEKPNYAGARNLLARCFYFLGNPDRTIAELEFILNDAEQGRMPEERLDALFLIGAAVVEQPGTSRKNLEKGKWAWETYLAEAAESPQRDQVKEGLELIYAGLRGEGKLAQAPTVQKQAAMAGGQNVMGGDASFEQPRPGGPQGGAPKGPPPERFKNLPADASDYDKAVAQGLDALDGGNPAGAEGFLKQAQQMRPGQPDVLVGLGRVFVQTGRIDESLRTFGEAIKLHPGYMPAWHYNGMAHMMSGDGKQAAESWEHIMKTDPAYAQKFSLDRRAQVARRMAQGR
jgi:tetratricopeptide (TPR) repeat protein